MNDHVITINNTGAFPTIAYDNGNGTTYQIREKLAYNIRNRESRFQCLPSEQALGNVFVGNIPDEVRGYVINWITSYTTYHTKRINSAPTRAEALNRQAQAANHLWEKLNHSLDEYFPASPELVSRAEKIRNAYAEAARLVREAESQ